MVTTLPHYGEGPHYPYGIYTINPCRETLMVNLRWYLFTIRNGPEGVFCWAMLLALRAIPLQNWGLEPVLRDLSTYVAYL